MSKVLWFYDASILKHPIASQVFEDLVNSKFHVQLISTDNENPIFNFSKTRELIDDLPVRKSLRKAKYQERISKRKFLGKNIIAHIYRRFIDILNLIDKKTTRFYSRQIVRRTAYLKALARVLKNEEQSRIVLLSRPTVIPHTLLYLLVNWKNWNKVQIIYFPFELYGQQTRNFSIMICKIEKWFIRHKADLLITQNEQRRQYYNSISPKTKTLIVKNYKRKQRIQTQQKRKKSDKEIRMVFIGLVDYGREVELLVESLFKIPKKYSLTLLGNLRKTWKVQNSSIINEGISSGRLFIKQAVPEEELLAELQEFDIGIITYDKSCLNHHFCAPAKLTDYWQAGIPIVASNLPSLKPYSFESPYIQLFDWSEPESFLSAIQNASKYTSRGAKQRIIQETRKYCWETQSDLLIQSMKELERRTKARDQKEPYKCV